MINEVIARSGLPSAIRVLPGLRHRSKVQKAGWQVLPPAGSSGSGLHCVRKA
jgi:hypothetical protein